MRLRYRRHFKDPDIRRHDMQHEELLAAILRDGLMKCATAVK